MIAARRCPIGSTTVYPTTAGKFPAASFWTFDDALAYIQDLQPLPCGVFTCPARSFEMNYKETVK